MTPGLAHYKAMLWRVWSTAVHGYDRGESRGGEVGKKEQRQIEERAKKEGEDEVEERKEREG